MNIQILNDLHIEFAAYQIDYKNADVVVLAGDIHVKDRGVKWALENIKHIPVIYVLGNHEFYGKAYPKLIDSLKQLSANTNVHVLEKNNLNIDGVNFYGCTLWTDFELLGDPRTAGFECQQIMNDYRKIRLSPSYYKLRSVDVVAINRQSKQWLVKALNQTKGQTNVVITHHAPSIKSLPEQKRDQLISSAYASHFDELILEHEPDYWIHGHIHKSADYLIGKCRVLSNPRGYPDSFNPDFKDELIIGIE